MYQCIPRNARGEGQRGTGKLEVRYEPVFTVTPKANYTKDIKDSIQIRCDAEGVPTPQFSWVKATDSTFKREGKYLYDWSQGWQCCNTQILRYFILSSTFVFILGWNESSNQSDH